MAGTSSHVRASMARLVLALLCFLFFPGVASAYIGPSYLQVPGVDGGWAGQPYKNWIRANSSVWRGSRIPPFGSLVLYAGPIAPREGASGLTIAVDKRSPGARALMDACIGKKALAEVTYAESSAMSGGAEIGDRPPQIPAFFEYRLTDVRISDCPVVAAAPEQAFVIDFKAIQWLNYDLPPAGLPPLFRPATLRPEPDSGGTRAFVVTWFGVANDVSDDQCPVMSSKPSPDEYYTYLPSEDVEKERSRLAPAGPGNTQLGQRGPNKLDVTRLPGIVPDPGQPRPQTKAVRGMDLDGRGGVDNQYFAAVGCVPGVLGHKGFGPQFTNSQMRDGEFSILIQLSGIDDPRNDDSVDVTWFYSQDGMAKSAAGSQILPDYTFRITDKPQYAHYFTRLHGRIVDGVVITDPAPQFSVFMGQYGFPAGKRFVDARMRLELLPNGSLKGVLGAYQSLWPEANRFTTAGGENQWNFVAPATYNALKHAADGLKNLATGEYEGISTAYDIEAVPAFIAEDPPKKVVGQSKALVAEPGNALLPIGACTPVACVPR